MAPTRGIRMVAAFITAAALALQVAAQTATDGTTPIATAPPSTTATSAASTITPASTLDTASTSADVPLSVWALANSLLSSYYPSTTLTQVASLTWPSAVVIGSSTYSVPPSSFATASPATSVLAESTNAPSGNTSHGLRSDEKLGIGIGVAVGAVALIVLAVVFCCVHKRRKATGAFFKQRPAPSVTESDIEGWRSPVSGETSTRSSGPSREWAEKYNRMSSGASGPMQPPPMAMHPAFMRQHSSWSTSEENPFYTPNETPDPYETAGAGTASYKQLEPNTYAQRRSSDSVRPGSRASTPFSPAMMMMSGAHPTHQQQQHNPFSNPVQHNPFSSPEDDEMDDIVSPIIPTRSPERRHSPMVHYPSWSEVSEFDFSGEGRAARALRTSLRGQPIREDGGDGWRPVRDSAYGRHELA